PGGSGGRLARLRAAVEPGRVGVGLGQVWAAGQPGGVAHGRVAGARHGCPARPQVPTGIVERLHPRHRTPLGRMRIALATRDSVKQPMTGYVVEVKRPNSAFFFCHFPLPREEIGRMPLNDRFEGARLGMLANTPGATFISQRDIKLDRHPGREYVLDVQKKGKMTVRIYCVDERELYMLLAGGDNFEPNTPDVVKFCDSFKLRNR